MQGKSLVYDIEVYPNVFICGFSDGSLFEISWRKHEVDELIEFMNSLDEMIGYNNVAYDYPVLHFIIQNRNKITPKRIYEKSCAMISSSWDSKFKNIIWGDHRCVKQIDLFLVHHFDNQNKSTSLKALEFAMRSDSIADLPIPAGTVLLDSQIEELIKYNAYDIDQTVKFLEKSHAEIAFRREVAETLKGDVLNFNDIKLGTKYLTAELERVVPGTCFDPNGKKRQSLRKFPYMIPPFLKDETLNQKKVDAYNKPLPEEAWLCDEPLLRDFTKEASEVEVPKRKEFKTERSYKAALNRVKKNAEKAFKRYERAFTKWHKDCKEKHEMNLEAIWVIGKEIVFDYIRFSNPKFNDALNYFKALKIMNTEGSSHYVTSVRGVKFHLGTGGIHGSVNNEIIHSDEDYEIRDIDAKGYYADIAIKNDVAPGHLGKTFCDVYSEMFQRRGQHRKGTSENLMLKQALVGTFGNSKNKYSHLFDPKYTMTITINGQLLILMLADQLLGSKDVKLIQINTDGLTIRYPRTLSMWVDSVEKWWEKVTMLELENVLYKSMYIRDVNNYIGVYTDGKRKRKGAYGYEVGPHELGWHKNHSHLVVQRAAEAFLLKGTDIEEFISVHGNIHDFMLLGKVNKGCSLSLVNEDGTEEGQGKTIRFYMSTKGRELVKYMPPLPKSPDKIRRNAYQGSKGWKVVVCNDINNFVGDIDYSYYIELAHNLVDKLKEAE